MRVAFYDLRPRRRLAKGRSCAIRVLAAGRTDGPSQRRRVASTRSAASGRPERLTRTVHASRQQVSHYAGLLHNAQMACTHYGYGAYLQQNPARFEHLMDSRAAGCGVQWVCV